MIFSGVLFCNSFRPQVGADSAELVAELTAIAEEKGDTACMKIPMTGDLGADAGLTMAQCARKMRPHMPREFSCRLNQFENVA